MADIKQKTTTLVSLGTTALNSLAGTTAVITTEYDNATNLYERAWFELYVASFASAPVVDTRVEAYLLKALDGTNYEDGSVTGPIKTEATFIGAFVLRAVATAQRMTLRGNDGPIVELPPCKFKIMLYNGSAQAFASSGNVLSMLVGWHQSV